jgi:hypothetical protein
MRNKNKNTSTLKTKTINLWKGLKLKKLPSPKMCCLQTLVNQPRKELKKSY